MSDKVSGRVPDGTGLSSPTEPVPVSALTGFDPSREAGGDTPSLSDRDLRLECARLAAVFSDGDLDRVANAARLYHFIRGQQVLEILRARCSGKQLALAHEAGVSESYVSRVFSGEIPPSNKLLRLIGYRRVTAYEPVGGAA